jgi:hypothetical protein
MSRSVKGLGLEHVKLYLSVPHTLAYTRDNVQCHVTAMQDAELRGQEENKKWERKREKHVR